MVCVEYVHTNDILADRLHRVKEEKQVEAKKMNRRDFLRMSTLTAAGLALAGCAQPTAAPATEEAVEEVVEATKPPEATEAPAPTEAPAQPEPVTLEIQSQNPEYENAQRQIWAIFEAENPGVTVEMYSVNEDQMQAYTAKLAGGWRPAIERASVDGYGPNKESYQNFVNLLELDFPWWDRYHYDAKEAFYLNYGVEDYVPTAGWIYIGRVFTWQYHKDLMEQAGLDPRNDVKTWDDLQDLLAEGTAWAESNPDVDHFLDMGWDGWAVGRNYVHALSMAFPDGQRDRQRQCYLGEIPFNADDSPYRHTFEALKQWYDGGILPREWWTRIWDADMETSYIAKKSVMMLHGPWLYEKAAAADPSVQQEGFPTTPPAEGQETWTQFMNDAAKPGNFTMWKEVMDRPEWPIIEKAYFWWYSPPVVKLRAEIQRQPTVYTLDEPLELEGGQWDAILTEFYSPDGLYSDAVVEATPTGELAAGRYQLEGGIYPFDEGGALPAMVGDLMQDKMTVQDLLDWAQGNWEESYDVS